MKTETHGDTDFYKKLKRTLIHVLKTRQPKRTVILITETYTQTVTDLYKKLKRTLIHVLNTGKTEMHIDTCIKHKKTETHGDIED